MIDSYFAVAVEPVDPGSAKCWIQEAFEEDTGAVLENLSGVMAERFKLATAACIRSVLGHTLEPRSSIVPSDRQVLTVRQLSGSTPWVSANQVSPLI